MLFLRQQNPCLHLNHLQVGFSEGSNTCYGDVKCEGGLGVLDSSGLLLSEQLLP